MGNSEIKRQFESNTRQLIARSVDETHIAFWGKIWSRNLTTNDLSMLTSDNLREIRIKQPNNFISLVRNVTAKMKSYVTKDNVIDDFQCTINCLRLLTRILPLAFEDETFANIFWEPQAPLPRERVQVVDTTKKTLEGDPETVIEENPALNEGANASTIILAPLILDILIDLLFLDKFTIPLSKEALDTALENLPDFSQGIFNKQSNPILQAIAGCSKTMVSNRIEVLLCLIVCCSSALYHKAPILSTHSYNIDESLESPVYPPTSNKWVEYIVSLQHQKSQALFCVLLYGATSYDPIGWGVPYNHIWFTDPHEMQMERSLHLLAILLEYRGSTGPTNPVQTEQQQQQQQQQGDPKEVTNTFVERLARVQASVDLAMVWSGLSAMLNNPLEANNTYLPYSTKLTWVRQEMFILFWYFLLVNKEFLDWGTEHGKLMEVTYPIVYYMHEGRKDQAQVGMVHLVALNTPFNKRPRIDIKNQNVNYADFLLVTLTKLIWDAHPRLTPLRECCLTVLANITPYTKSLSSSTAASLLKLFTLLTQPKFLFSNENNYRCCFFMLEAFNNILQYQYAGNKHLVYAIIRNKSVFSKLMQLRISEENGDVHLGNEESRTSGRDILEPEQQQQPQQHQQQQQQQVPQIPPKIQPQLQLQPHIQPQIPEQVKPPIQLPLLELPQPSPEIKLTEIDLEQLKFVPTNEWLLSWQKQLPIMTVLRFLKAVVPKVEHMVSNSAEDENKILTFLENNTVVGLLPLPHPIILRRFWPTPHALNWFHCYMWGVVFLKNTGGDTTFMDTQIQLFTVHAKKQQ